MTAQPNAHVRFRRAIERRALWMAEDGCSRAPNLPLQDALQLVRLYADRGSPKFERAAIKWPAATSKRTRLRSSISKGCHQSRGATQIGEYPFEVPARLIARLSDGSEHEVKMGSGDPEQARQYLVKTDRRWVDVIGGSVRYDSIVSLLIVEEPTDEERDRAINGLLHDLQKRGGGTLDGVRHELDVRGIELG